MSLHYRISGSKIIVLGNTYPHKEQIKALGGRFNGMDKSWWIPLSDHGTQSIDELCKGAGGGPLGGDPESTTDSVSDPLLNVTTRREPANLSPVADDAAANDSLSVSELMRSVGLAIQNRFPDSVWVIGEVQNLAKRPSGWFLELAEPNEMSGSGGATITAKSTIWSSIVRDLAVRHKDFESLFVEGTKVRCKVRVRLYADRGQVSLNIEEIDPAYTRGALALAREKLIRKLKKEGLFGRNRNLDLTPFPLRVGLITASGSRAYSDFCDQITSRGFPGTILFRPTPMQGEHLPVQIPQSIQELLAQKVDVIVMTRGGGSQADLRWFDTEEVARAICLAPVPVLAAIGHHDDESVAELTAHTHEKTPTAAAEFIIRRITSTRDRLTGIVGEFATKLTAAQNLAAEKQFRLMESLQGRGIQNLEQRQKRLSNLGHYLLTESQRALNTKDSALQSIFHQISRAADGKINHIALELTRLETSLTKADPKPWVNAGWTRLFNDKGMIRESSHLQVGDTVEARLRDGLVILETKKVEPRPWEPTNE